MATPNGPAKPPTLYATIALVSLIPPNRKQRAGTFKRGSTTTQKMAAFERPVYRTESMTAH
jgi:hypothetical protein